MTDLVKTKSMLAKLLATENITVQHAQVPTAYFDLQNRTLMCPIWQDMDGDIYDLLMGHEVGHALETPQEGWHNAVTANTLKFKDFLNVIEDARIEKKIKRKYPGLSKSFANAYKSLYERDFFGLSKLTDLSQLNLIDRINLRFKLGSHVVVQFNDEEREFVREVENAETWEQVVDIAQRVYGYVKKNENDKIMTQSDLAEALREAANKLQQELNESLGTSDEEEDSDEESEDGEEYGDSDEFGSAEEGEGFDDSEDNSESNINSQEQGEDADDEPQSVTDRIFRQRESELVNASGEVNILNLPKPDLKKIIVNPTEFVDNFERVMTREISTDPVYRNFGYNGVAGKCVRKFNENNKKYINLLVKEFEMRKQASAYARTHQARTGELDMQKLHAYKFTNDVFRKVAVVGKGKSHGMIMFIDMSGSMYGVLRNVVQQTMVLASFCKIVNIPFDVYGFTCDSNPITTFDHDKFVPYGDKDMFCYSGHFQLIHMLSSNWSKTLYHRCFDMLAIVANEHNRGRWDDPDKDHGNLYGWDSAGWGLDSTPTLQTLAASIDIIQKFKQDHKRDIVNVIHLTDGVGDANGFHFTGVNWRKGHSTYVVHKPSQKKIRVSSRFDFQNQLTHLVREVTGCKHIGYYIASDREFRDAMKNSDASAVVRKKAVQDNVFSTPALGYDQYFYIKGNQSSLVAGELKVDGKKQTKAAMANAFKKMQAGKSSSRVLATRFAQEIAA